MGNTMTEIEKLTPEEARGEIERIPLDADLVAALQDPAHPAHKAATERRRGLYSAAYPDVSEEGELAKSKTDDSASAQHFDVPENPGEYRFETTPPALEPDPALEQKARDWFHTAGAPQWLARNVVSEWNRAAVHAEEGDDSAQQAATTGAALRRDWGDAFEAKLAKAKNLLRSLDDPEVSVLLNRSGLGNNEYLIRQLVALAENADQPTERP
jgi:hypothetical protein